MAVPGPSHMHGTAATQAESGLPRQADAAIALVVVSLQPQPPNPGGVGAWVVVAGSRSPRGLFFFLLASWLDPSRLESDDATVTHEMLPWG